MVYFFLGYKDFLCLRGSVHLEEGVNFKSVKYGEINGWKPDRRMFMFIPLDFRPERGRECADL